MSRQEVIRVTCDVCGNKLDVRPDEAEWAHYTIPVLVVSHTKRLLQRELDLCNACAGKLAIIEATPITTIRYDPVAYEDRPHPTGRYTYRFREDE